jgi:predicted nucleotidyltransferase
VGSDLANQLRLVGPDVFGSLPVRWAYLFGSHAEGRSRADSDVDVAVVLTEDVATSDALRMQSRCADALSVATAIGGIEVVALNGAPLRFIGRVLRQ